MASTMDTLNAPKWPAALGEFTRTQLIFRAVVFLLVALVAKSLYNGLSMRLKFRRLRSQGIVSLWFFPPPPLLPTFTRSRPLTAGWLRERRQTYEQDTMSPFITRGKKEIKNSNQGEQLC